MCSTTLALASLLGWAASGGPERSDDLVSAKTVRKLARSNFKQGGGPHLDAVGLCECLQDLLSFHLAEAGKGEGSGSHHRSRAAAGRGARLHHGVLAFEVRR